MADEESNDSVEEKKEFRHKRPEHKKYMEHSIHKKTKGLEAAAWTFGILTVILAILFIVSLATKGFSGTGSGATTTTTGNLKALSESEVKQKTLDYLNALMSGQGQTVTIDSVQDAGDLYSMKINIGGRNYDSYARKDGSVLFPSGIDLTKDLPTATQNAATPTPTTVPKTDKPTVELFVMSYCPYGTQAEKGILPAVRTLGDKVDFKVRFVYYAMHGKKEVDENLRQYCMREQMPDKYLSYLACFLNATDSPGCLKQAGIDQTKLDACTASADAQFNVTKLFNDQSTWLSGQFPLQNFDATLNKKYSVGGSPTLVINGVQSNAGRDSASFLKGICGAFTTPPAECNTQLDSASPSPGFGYGTAAAATAAGCGV